MTLDRLSPLRRIPRILGRSATGARALLSALSICAVLAGCALPVKQQAALASARASATASYQGRFAVRYADGYGHVQNAYGNFAWDEQADAVTLSLQNPLGSTMAIISATPTSATLELPGKAPQTAPNVEALMQRSLGFPMPVSGLRYWLRDQAGPTSHATTTTDAQGRITQIIQDGWQIDVLAFADAQEAKDAQEAPDAAPSVKAAPVIRRMNLERIDNTSDTPLQVKLVINP
jgi:outer membrane lipoprotein LolB